MKNRLGRGRGEEIMSKLKTAVLSGTLLAALVGPLLAQPTPGLREYDATVVDQLHPTTFMVRDTHCSYHEVETDGAVLNGKVMSPRFRHDLPFNAHIVARTVVYANGNHDDYAIAITQQSSPGAPRNCDVYSATRAQDGFLAGISFGNAAGGLFITTDTGSSVSFGVSAGGARKVLLDGKPLPVCSNWPEHPCEDCHLASGSDSMTCHAAMVGYSTHTRVRVRYRVRMSGKTRDVELLSVTRIPSK